MTIEIDFPPDVEAQLQEAAARLGQEPADIVRDLVRRQLLTNELETLKGRTPPKSVEGLKPRVPSPPGSSWLAQVVGQWPGDESDDEIHRALEELS
jgi:hypothetical protein